MEPINWIAIYLPLFVLFLVILPEQSRMAAAARRIHAKRRSIKVTNEVIVKYIGRNCLISAGSYGVSTSGRIVSVNGNWVEVETKKGATELINADYIQSIRIMDK
ncbi:MAG TPA: hypothetical protein VN540_10155 [Clostridia bacterium]|nr:hypothetical protein [Clostridia bacterium]